MKAWHRVAQSARCPEGEGGGLLGQFSRGSMRAAANFKDGRAISRMNMGSLVKIVEESVSLGPVGLPEMLTLAHVTHTESELRMFFG